MTCKECEERRRKMKDAIFRAKLGEAMGHAVIGLAEITGMRTKDATNATNELERSEPEPMGDGDKGTPVRSGKSKCTGTVKRNDKDPTEWR